MSQASNPSSQSEMMQVAVVGVEHSDRYGHLHSTAGLRLMGGAVLAAATSVAASSYLALTTEQVAFFEPVPVGHTVAFRSSFETLPSGKLRASVEGLSRFPGGAARCVMTGRFLLTAAGNDQPPLPTTGGPSDARVA